MKTNLLTLLFALATIAPVRATRPVPIEPVNLTPSAAIQWEGRNHATLDAQRIAGSLSIRLENCSDIVISACELASVELAGCKNVTIRNSWIHDAPRIGVQISNSSKVLIQGCRFENVVSGVWAVDSQSIQVIGNFARNVQGPLPRGQLAQFDNVKGPGNAIRANYAINDLGKSHPEDVINLFKSAGEKDSPILIEDNYLTGDPVQGSQGKSQNGSGIMMADMGGAYQICRHNVILSAGQVGIGVAGGTNIRVEENLVYGQKSDVSNNGLYAWNQSGKPSDHVTIARNRVSWVNKDGEETSWWDGKNVQNLELIGNHFADATLPIAIPAPPSIAPMPPQPVLSENAKGEPVARLPWKP